MADLPQEVSKVVDTLAVGQISEPFIMMNPKTNREVVAIVKLTNRIDGHRANMADDYQVLKSMYERSRQQEIIAEWIKKKQRETFIRIEEGWRNCDFEYDGWLNH